MSYHSNAMRIKKYSKYYRKYYWGFSHIRYRTAELILKIMSYLNQRLSINRLGIPSKTILNESYELLRLRIAQLKAKRSNSAITIDAPPDGLYVNCIFHTKYLAATINHRWPPLTYKVKTFSTWLLCICLALPICIVHFSNEIT